MDEHLITRGQQWLEDLLNFAGSPASVNVEPEHPFSEDTCWIAIDETSLTPTQVECLIGREGHVLDSIQYLMNSILNLGQASEMQGAFTVELAGYRQQRYSELKAMADQAVAQARETGEEYELKSLSSAERRQVHTMLKEYADLETYSRGQEPDRRLVVRLLQSEP